MPFTVKLQPAFGFPALWTVLGVFLLVTPIAVFAIFLLKRYFDRKPKKEPQPVKTEDNRYQRLERIRSKYLASLNALEQKKLSGRISQRASYLELSAIARGFIYECTGTDTRTKTLTELRKMNLTELAKLVDDYYEPEFAREPRADFSRSCAETRRMIRKWNVI